VAIESSSKRAKPSEARKGSGIKDSVSTLRFYFKFSLASD
jgi:hypothetical protein